MIRILMTLSALLLSISCTHTNKKQTDSMVTTYDFNINFEANDLRMPALNDDMAQFKLMKKEVFDESDKARAYREMAKVESDSFKGHCVPSSNKEALSDVERCPENWPAQFEGLPLLGARKTKTGTDLNYFLIYGGTSMWTPEIVALWSDEKIQTAFRIIPYKSHRTNFSGENREARSPAYLKDIQKSGDVVYMSFAHSEGAKALHSLNANLTAFDIKEGRVLWRTRPLTANAENFVVLPEMILTGYGFPSEKSFIYAIDPKTGRALNQLALPSHPEEIFTKKTPEGKDELFILASGHNLLYELKYRKY